jgi:DNA-binding MarR family transcriptional regulator
VSNNQTSPKYIFSDQVGHLLRKVYQRHVAIFQQSIPDSQLTAAQFVTMCAIQEWSPCSLSAIVKATAIDQATIRGIVERLKARELITVTHDAEDKRKLMVLLTPAGTNLLNATIPFAFQITESTFGNLNPAERLALMHLLRKMAA